MALECCLEDEHENVRRAAAITMYTLERPIPKVCVHRVLWATALTTLQRQTAVTIST